MVGLTVLVAMGAMDLSEALPSITLPTRLVVGSHDRLTPPARARRIASLVPGAQLEVVPDAGHMLPFETPDRLVEMITAMSPIPDTRERSVP